NGYSGLFGGTITIILFTLLLQVFFFKDIKTIKKNVTDITHIEKAAPNMLRDKKLFVPFLAFILLHIGQWMYTLNMPLYVTKYL
ncbi:MFS transporter, partial [Enterobacter mori]